VPAFVPLEDAEICGLVTVDCKLGVSEPGMLVDQDHLSTYSGRFRPHNSSTRLTFKQDEPDMPAHDTNLSRFSPVKWLCHVAILSLGQLA